MSLKTMDFFEEARSSPILTFVKIKMVRYFFKASLMYFCTQPQL